MTRTVRRKALLCCLALFATSSCDRSGDDAPSASASTATTTTGCKSALTGRLIALRPGASAIGGDIAPSALEFRAGEYALTIDGGPAAATLPGLLALLRKNCVKATFFLNGKTALAQKALVAEILRDGHSLGSLTWDASSRPTSEADVETALRRGAGAVEASGWERDIPPGQARLVRLPFMAHHQITDTFASFLRRESFIVANVDADPEDWRNQPPRISLRRMLAAFPDRGVIRIHDGPPNSVELLGLIFSLLEQRKATLVTIAIADQQARSTAR